MAKVRRDSKRRKLAQIAREIAPCSRGRSENIGKPVAGDGSPDARLVFVGEAPGRNEALIGHAFIGRSGKLLRQSSRFLGPKRKIFLTNAWTEAVTLVTQTGVPDEVYQLARTQFSEKELVDLTMAIIAINGWNRLAVSFRALAGTYQPAVRTEAASGQRK